jgi:3'(2'), 5'-bisphosphate nucleotidase
MVGTVIRAPAISNSAENFRIDGRNTLDHTAPMKAAAPSKDMFKLLRIAQLAAREIMTVYASDFAVSAKADLSPVTEADALAEKVILKALRETWPEVPILAEEAASAGDIPDMGDKFFLVDPLDGTKEFTSRNGEFTVNIALVENQKPVMGVVYAPAIEQMYWGEAGKGAGFAGVTLNDGLADVTWAALRVRPAPTDGLTVVASRSHMDAATADYLKSINVKTLTSAGSSLKFCLIAKGDADLYPRFGRTMEWDTGAGQAVLEAAGGTVCNVDGACLLYRKAERGFDNPAFIASA